MLKFSSQTRFSRYALAFAAAFALQACGGGSDSGTNNPPSSTGKIALLAGDVGGLGNLDGSRDSATFYGIQSLTVDPAGNLMVAESGNLRCARSHQKGWSAPWPVATWSAASRTARVLPPSF